jgi:hypothetical protein
MGYIIYEAAGTRLNIYLVLSVRFLNTPECLHLPSSCRVEAYICNQLAKKPPFLSKVETTLKA